MSKAAEKMARAAGVGRTQARRPVALMQRFLEVPVDLVMPNPDQPRKHFDPDKLAELAESIQEHGVIQALTVRPPDSPGGPVILIAGERRLRAARLAGLMTVPCMIEGGDPEVLALIENMARADLTPLEEAEALARIKHKQGLTLKELGKLTGKKASTLSELVSIANLPPSIKERLALGKGNLPRRALAEIAKIDKAKGPSAALEAFESARAGANREAIKAARKPVTKPKPPKAAQTTPPTPDLQAARASDTARRLASQILDIDPSKIKAESMRTAYKSALMELGSGIKSALLKFAKAGES